MGLTFTTLASMRRQLIENFCHNQTGSSNCYHKGSDSYMIEWGTRQNRDGAITGQILKYTSDTTVEKTGSIRIEGDGTIQKGRAPAVLRCVPFLFVKLDNSLHGVWPAELGNPTLENLVKYVEQYEASFRPGGVNYHVSRSLGKLTFANSAQIINGDTNTVVAEWKAPAFRIVA